MALVCNGVRGLLAAASVGSLTPTADWAIHVSQLPPNPDRVIGIFDTGFILRDPKWLLDYVTFQVRVRGRAGEYQTAYGKAIAVGDALIGLPSQTISGDRWVSLVHFGTAVVSIGQDELDRPEIVSNFRLIIEPATGGYRLPLGA